MKPLPLLLLFVFAPACSSDRKKKTSTPPAASGEQRSGAVRMQGTFEGALDLSGLAVMNGGTRGIIVSDELRAAQAVTRDPDNGTISAGATIPLFSQNGSTEADLEGAAANPEAACYYAVGSHGVSKKKGEFQEDRCFVFRIPADAAGAPQAAGLTSTSLLPWLRQSQFAGAVGQPLQRGGFNIEGLACKNGKLFFGVRGPSQNGHAFVLETGAESLFQAALPAVIVHELPLGAGFGIRELVALQEGFLVLAGNAASEPSKQQPESADYDENRGYVFWWWKPGTAASAVKLGELPAGKAKAEGLLVLSEDDTTLKTLVVFDGVENGGPEVLDLKKPAP